jgi:hypothetical protein
MKAILAILMVAALAGCASRTEFGPCVGIGDEKDPHLTYKVSARNLIVGLVFWELLAPPVVVAVDEFYCPVAAKQ